MKITGSWKKIKPGFGNVPIIIAGHAWRSSKGLKKTETNIFKI
jgi:hypothetical protein